MTILQPGIATLEIANPAQRRMIDEVEVEHSTAPGLRWRSRYATLRMRPGPS